jgi:mono/diheme cytochrome c family protein
MCSNRIRPLVAFTLLQLALVPVDGTAQGTQTKPTVKSAPAKDISPTDGPGMFRSYCAPCHGMGGKGDGPAAEALTPRPADLTLFASRRGGKFSVKDFEDRLQGVKMAPAHGSSAMPVWGPVLRQLGSEPLRIANLRAHVESLQVK